METIVQKNLMKLKLRGLMLLHAHLMSQHEWSEKNSSLLHSIDEGY